MTSTKIMTMGLRRAGLPIAVAAYKTAARDVLNMGLRDLVNRRQWRWRYKEGTITTVASQRTYSLASDCLRPLPDHWRHVTDDTPIRVRELADSDWGDPDEDSEGSVRFVLLKGISASTGYWQVDLIDTPDTSGDTIKYRYLMKAASLNDDGTDDDTDLDTSYPDWVQNALHLWVSAYMKGEEGDAQGQIEDLGLYESLVLRAEKTDALSVEVKPIRLARKDESDVEFAFKVVSLNL